LHLLVLLADLVRVAVVLVCIIETDYNILQDDDPVDVCDCCCCD
jgi:hypothetical protein